MVDYWFAQPVFYGVSSFLRRTGRYQLELHADRPEVAPVAVHGSFDGFITIGHRQTLLKIMEAGRPVVSIGWAIPEQPVPSISIDEVAIGQLGAEHLLGQGHRHFAFFGADDAWSRARLNAFAEVLARHGHSCTHTSSGNTPDRLAGWHQVTDEAFVRRWLGRLNTPIAIMAADDRLARLLANACIALNLRIPLDVAIVGVDNLDAFCETESPSLSSVDPGAERLGHEAAVLLDRMFRGEQVPPVPVIVRPNGVIARESTAALAFQDPEIVAAMRYIRENACNDIDVSSICQAIHSTRRRFERRFIQTIGHTPFEEIRRQRMEKARQLLVETDMKMLAIAIRCGYETAASFVTAFRERVGCTPEVYRKQHS